MPLKVMLAGHYLLHLLCRDKATVGSHLAAASLSAC